MTTEYLAHAPRPAVRVERHYPHPIDKVWRAVTIAEHLGRWFPSPVEIDLRPGGALRFDDGEGEVGVIEALDPPRLLAFTWGTDRLRFELAPIAGGTSFALVHSFDDRAGAASFATGWEMCLGALRRMLAGEPPPPDDRGVARHEELVEVFGLDRPQVTDDGDRWTVRIERQLTCPAEVAWDLWFGVDRASGEQRRAPAIGEPLTPYMAPDLVIGTMTDVDHPRLLAFSVAPTGGPGEHVRVELAEGTGHALASSSPSPAPIPPSGTRRSTSGGRAPWLTWAGRRPAGRCRARAGAEPAPGIPQWRRRRLFSREPTMPASPPPLRPPVGVAPCPGAGRGERPWPGFAAPRRAPSRRFISGMGCSVSVR